MEFLIKGLVILAIALTQVLDWHSTKAFLKSGYGYEANDLLQRLQKKYGVDRVMIIKGLLHLPICYPIWIAPLAVCIGFTPFFLIYFNVIRKNYRIARGGYRD